MTYYTLEELGVQEGDIVRTSFITYTVIDLDTLETNGIRYNQYRGSWGQIFQLVSKAGPPEKKGYAKWVSEREGT